MNLDIIINIKYIVFETTAASKITKAYEKNGLILPYIPVPNVLCLKNRSTIYFFYYQFYTLPFYYYYTFFLSNIIPSIIKN
jgi:hypothetical protein